MKTTLVRNSKEFEKLSFLGQLLKCLVASPPSVFQFSWLCLFLCLLVSCFLVRDHFSCLCDCKFVGSDVDVGPFHYPDFYKYCRRCLLFLLIRVGQLTQYSLFRTTQKFHQVVFTYGMRNVIFRSNHPTILNFKRMEQKISESQNFKVKVVLNCQHEWLKKRRRCSFRGILY